MFGLTVIGRAGESNTVSRMLGELLLLDIEGTTTSINFVKHVLFPYSYTQAYDYLKENWKFDKIKNIIEQLIEIRDQDYQDAPEIYKITTENDAAEIDKHIQTVTKVVKHFIKSDLKIAPLKELQGLIWEEGYKNGDFKGHVYIDAVKIMKECYENNIPVYIYSSGSEQAQKLLFQYSEHGNLLKYITGHFDTSIGHKRSRESYKNIVKKLHVDPEDIIFFTDIKEEAQAAVSAGVKCILVTRNSEIEDNFVTIKSFDDIQIRKVDIGEGTSRR